MDQKMDILFNDTSSTKKKKNQLSSKGTGFSQSKVKSTSALNLFDADDLFSTKSKDKKDDIMPPPIKRDSSKDNLARSKDPNEVIYSFLRQHPEIEEFVRISPFNEFACPPDKDPRKVYQDELSAEATRFQQVTPEILDATAKVDKQLEKVKQKYFVQKVPSGATMTRRGLHSLSYSLRVDRLDLIKKNIDHVLSCVQFIGNFIHIFSTNPVTQELKISVSLIESRIHEFQDKDPQYQKMTQFIHHVDKELRKPDVVDYSWPTIRDIVSKLFNPLTGYFTDQGEAESLFSLLVDNLPNEIKASIEKRIAISITHPNAVGKAILTQSTELMKHLEIDSEQNMQYMFILFARYFFSNIYMQTIGPNIFNADKSDFTTRLRRLRTVPPIGFGFSGNFLPKTLKSIPLGLYPQDNPYREAIGLFQLLQFQTCPLDFCKAVHDALKTIQSVASEISFQIKTDANNGKVYAKSDHLLCLDDLFDISLLVLILAAPVSLEVMVKQFEPFIESLEMTADLEFAFTNISAMVKHICEMDIDKFVQDAKAIGEQFIEKDPLLN